MSLRFNSVNTMFAELEAEYLTLMAERDEARAKVASLEREAEEIAITHNAELRRVVSEERKRLFDRLHVLFKDEYADVLVKQLGIVVDFKHIPDGQRSTPPFL